MFVSVYSKLGIGHVFQLSLLSFEIERFFDVSGGRGRLRIEIRVFRARHLFSVLHFRLGRHMKYKDRNAKDRSILVGISRLSLPERYKRIQELELALKNADADFQRKRAVKKRTKQQERQLLADKDGTIELRDRLTLESAEYLALKEISPDYIEAVG